MNSLGMYTSVTIKNRIIFVRTLFGAYYAWALFLYLIINKHFKNTNFQTVYNLKYFNISNKILFLFNHLRP